MSAGLPEAIATRRHLLGTAVLLLLAFVVSLRLFEILWDREALADIGQQPGDWAGAAVVVAASAVVHELLHGIGWNLFARVPWQSIAFRPTWRGMGVGAHADAAMPASAFRAGAALPALLLGSLPILLGLATGCGLLVLWGLFFLLECFSDVAVLLATATLPSRAQVRPHPTKLGCRLAPDVG